MDLRFARRHLTRVDGRTLCRRYAQQRPRSRPAAQSREDDDFAEGRRPVEPPVARAHRRLPHQPRDTIQARGGLKVSHSRIALCQAWGIRSCDMLGHQAPDATVTTFVRMWDFQPWEGQDLFAIHPVACEQGGRWSSVKRIRASLLANFEAGGVTGTAFGRECYGSI